jgi:hypothetical protein
MERPRNRRIFLHGTCGEPALQEFTEEIGTPSLLKIRPIYGKSRLYQRDSGARPRLPQPFPRSKSIPYEPRNRRLAGGFILLPSNRLGILRLLLEKCLQFIGSAAFPGSQNKAIGSVCYQTVPTWIS